MDTIDIVDAGASRKAPRRSSGFRIGSRVILCALGVLGVLGVETTGILAQIGMPDPKQMSGIPRPVGVDELPSGSVSVRVIRGALTNNIAGQPVELHVGDKVQTAKTDEAGRAQFDRLPAGASLKAVTVVDGERLESQVFPAPATGGIRVMLVATDKEKEARAAEAAKAPAVPGQVVLGGETRMVIEPGDEVVDLYYMIDIVNNASTPVNTASLFTFDVPKGATPATLFRGSSPLAAATGTRVRVQGPFPPGKTSLQVATQLPVRSGSLEIVQTFPAKWEQPLFIMKKFGSAVLSSPQIIGQQDMPENGAVMAGANGLPAGQPLTLVLSGLPHHSGTPRIIALTVAGLIAICGAWFARRPREAPVRKDERKRLVARREKLLQDLVRLENDQRGGRGDPGRYAARREELVASLERVYGALDTDDSGPGPAPADRPGVAR